MQDDIKKLSAMLAVRKRGTGTRYPQHVRDQIAEAAKGLRARGTSWQKISEVLGVPLETIGRYVAAAAPSFVPVVVEDAPSSAPILVAPSGYRVEGLSLPDLAELLGRLR
jgi:hypothetical protein